MSALQHNTDEAIKFLKRWPCQMPQLTAIPIDTVTKEKGKLDVKSFTYDRDTKEPNWQEIREWIEERQGRANIYFTVNRLARPMSKKAEKTDISSVVALHVDVDVPEGDDQQSTADAIVERLSGYDPKPSAVVMSGGGAQAFWILEPTSRIVIGGDKALAEDAECYGRKIEKDLQADACHDVCRIMRLPGTINLADANKIKKGRGDAVARLVYFDDTTYPIGLFQKALPKDVAANDNVRDGPSGKVRKLTPAEWNARKDTVATLVNTFDADKLRERGVPEECITLLEDGDDGTYDGDDSNMLCAIAGYLLRAGLSMEETCAVVGTLSFAGCAHVKSLPKSQRWRAMYRVVNKASEGTDQRAIDAANGDGRVAITYDKFALGQTTVATIDAMVACKAPIYQNAGRLVHVYRQGQDSDAKDAIRYKAGSLLIEEVNHYRFGQYLEDVVRYYVETDKTVVRIPVPPNISENVRSRKDGWSGIRMLDGIAETPFLRADGTIVSEDGYDPASRMLLDKGGVDYRLGPSAPTQGECRAALAVLADLLKEFKFVDDASRSVAYSAILTGMSIHLMRNTPLHAYDANSIGTGKSTLADVVSIILQGREAPAMSFTDDPAESEKRWMSILMVGTKVVNIDNVTAGTVVGGATLNTVLTQPTFSTRLLGQNLQPEVSTSVLKQINGNNLTFSTDTASRTISARMDAGEERPDQRTFERDIILYTQLHRPKIVAAALTVLSGYYAAGRPFDKGLKESRFKEWDRIVRGAIIYAGGADPFNTQFDVDLTDPIKADRFALLEALAESFDQGQTFTSADLMAKITHEGDYSKLRMALMASASRSGQISTRGITAYLKRERDVITNGLVLRVVKAGGGETAARYRVENVTSPVTQEPKQASLALVR